MSNERKHRASYAANKDKPGEWSIRVVGPTPDRFVGREIPVTKKNGQESIEKLDRLVWTGMGKDDDGNPIAVAIYAFTAKPKPKRGEPAEEVPF